MASELPRRVKVGAFVWTVDAGPKATLELAKQGEYGETTLETLTIRVRGDMHSDVQLETLIHEMLHAALLQTPLAELPSEQQEAVCRALPPFLLEHMVVSEWTDV